MSFGLAIGRRIQAMQRFSRPRFPKNEYLSRWTRISANWLLPPTRNIAGLCDWWEFALVNKRGSVLT